MTSVKQSLNVLTLSFLASLMAILSLSADSEVILPRSVTTDAYRVVCSVQNVARRTENIKRINLNVKRIAKMKNARVSRKNSSRKLSLKWKKNFVKANVTAAIHMVPNTKKILANLQIKTL
jgi:hypothetical protein